MNNQPLANYGWDNHKKAYYIIRDYNFVETRYDDIEDGEVVVCFEDKPITRTYNSQPFSSYYFYVKVNDELIFFENTLDVDELESIYNRCIKFAVVKMRVLKIKKLLNNV